MMPPVATEPSLFTLQLRPTPRLKGNRNSRLEKLQKKSKKSIKLLNLRNVKKSFRRKHLKVPVKPVVRK